MVAWVVMNRQQPRQTPPSFFPAPIPILGLTPPSSQEKLPLCFHALTWNPFCNPFVFKFMHGMGGGYPPASRVPIPCPLCPERPSVWKGLSSPYILTRTFLSVCLHTRACDRGTGGYRFG